MENKYFSRSVGEDDWLDLGLLASRSAAPPQHGQWRIRNPSPSRLSLLGTRIRSVPSVYVMVSPNRTLVSEKQIQSSPKGHPLFRHGAGLDAGPAKERRLLQIVLYAWLRRHTCLLPSILFPSASAPQDHPRLPACQFSGQTRQGRFSTLPATMSSYPI
ncbi:hypothetical protein D8B26_000969 [Coccidioides posadasii str. Silveira]|uniref:uncharacterized protein n=1 Tax=Coccidioides posadasii (strain RMSCC 757 / Silveira) TaxID=443226 RepID=UPI001BF0F85C|nr:hypothetical protein D8B26_000969 [Coccidioides posadasii str. Silveira]